MTDDSPQRVWAVSGADYIFVPSYYTKITLEEFLRSNESLFPEVVVSPYPVSLSFSKPLKEDEFRKRREQLKPYSKEPLKIIIPVSGAAVQLDYFKEMISYLDKKVKAEVTVISRDSRYTQNFLKWCQKVNSCEVIADKFDKEVVESYEKEIENGIFSLEVTKPSEQAFKALINPSCRGGMILLFSEPVGRQEKDNLNFLKRNGLLPQDSDQKILDNFFEFGEKEKIDGNFLKRARNWRGLLLSTDGIIAGRAILKLRDMGIFKAMVNFSGFPQSRELRGDGVERFWAKLGKKVFKMCELGQ